MYSDTAKEAMKTFKRKSTQKLTLVQRVEEWIEDGLPFSYFHIHSNDGITLYYGTNGGYGVALAVRNQVGEVHALTPTREELHGLPTHWKKRIYDLCDFIKTKEG